MHITSEIYGSAENRPKNGASQFNWSVGYPEIMADFFKKLRVYGSQNTTIKMAVVAQDKLRVLEVVKRLFW